MENASKALLLAAGTLIGILIIVVAVRMFSSASGVTESYYSQESESEVAAFNSNFTKFVGATNGEDDGEIQFATIHDVISTANFAWNYNRKKALRMNINPLLPSEADSNEFIHVELCKLNFDSNTPGETVYDSSKHFENFTDKTYQAFIKNGYYVSTTSPDQDNVVTYQIEIAEYNPVGKIKKVKFYPSIYNNKGNHVKTTIETINNNLNVPYTNHIIEEKEWKK